MIPSRVIEAKRDGASIDRAELEAFLEGFLHDRVPDYQMAAFLMAVYFQGLDSTEADVLVRCMLESGSVLDLAHLPGPRIDKHSTGGVGDKVSLALAPLAAALGLYVPMMSGRGLGHTSGTLDKLEAFPGFRTQLGLAEFRLVLEQVGCAMIGQTSEIAPLDRRLYALRDVTATVPVIPLIAASIMSKKLAEGLDGLILDVKVGSGAFIPEEDRALVLAETMVGIGRSRGLATVALLTAMDRPLGRAVGNALETAEAVDCLRGEGPSDLEELVLLQATEMVMAGFPGTGRGEARDRAERALRSGLALERLERMVAAQGGDASVIHEPWRFVAAPERETVSADRSGTVLSVDPRPLGLAVVDLGGGRKRMDDTIHLGVGFELAVAPGDHVRPGDPLGTVHALDADGLRRGGAVLRGAISVGDGQPWMRPLISHRIASDGTVEGRQR
ncbi:MAG TPA: thymidine phosphorylase [Longimicrobiales bacterium]|nr:thymidine phosphorylase [Longimicrobiales bacterium]